MKNSKKIVIAMAMAITVLVISMLFVIVAGERYGQSPLFWEMFLCTLTVFICLLAIKVSSQPKPELIPGKRYHLHDIVEIGKEKIFILSYKEMVLQVEETRVAGFKNIIWLKRLPEIGQDYICFETGELV